MAFLFKFCERRPEILHKQRVIVHLLRIDVVSLHLGLDVLPLLLQVKVDVLVVMPLGGGPSRLGSSARDGSWNRLRNPCTRFMELLPTASGGAKDKNNRQPNLHHASHCCRFQPQKGAKKSASVTGCEGLRGHVRAGG